MNKNNSFLTLVLILLSILLVPSNEVNGQNNQIPVQLIAHRGGIIDETRSENSRAAIEEAILRGYWMIEIDLRKTSDGYVIVHHDPTFKKDYYDSRAVADMKWSEIRELRSAKDGSRPLLFEEVAQMASGKINLMLDVKGNDFEDSFYKEIENILKEHDLFSDTFVLSGSEAQDYFLGKLSLSIDFEDLVEAAKNDEDVSVRYHLFELGNNLEQNMINTAHKLGVRVVAAINVFRYQQMSGGDIWNAARQDIDRLMNLGVEYFQVDSIYEPLFKGE
ncbi:MAG: glycerophosphodiester phosphodiesterase family protein [Balneolaceae bacterium]